MSDTSFFDSRLYEERLQTEFLHQEAARLEVEYWRARMLKEGLTNTVCPTCHTDQQGKCVDKWHYERHFKPVAAGEGSAPK